MREILFRGISRNSGKWVNGVLINVGEYCCILDPNRIGYDRTYLDKDLGFIDGEAVPVIVKSVGQYTGVHDMNGKKIFEGDIVKYTQTYDVGCYPHTDLEIAVVEYNLGMFFPIGKYNTDRYEVIGNIHDNPELMDKVTVR